MSAARTIGALVVLALACGGDPAERTSVAAPRPRAPATRRAQVMAPRPTPPPAVKQPDPSPPPAPTQPPPAPPVEVIQARPGFAWIPGYYRWTSDAYVWVPGRLEAGHDGERFVPGAWTLRGAIYVYNAGAWVAGATPPTPPATATGSRAQAPMRELPSGVARPLAAGRALYVDHRAATEGDGSQPRPWRSLSAAAARLEPGDTLYLAAGTYHEPLTLTRSGTAEAPITIRAAPRAVVVITTARADMRAAAATAWEPVRGRAGEFRSVHPLPDVTTAGGLVAGVFADSYLPLHPYRKVEDFRSANELWNVPGNDIAGKGIYVGPGLWFDRATQRMHVRLGATSVRGIEAYRGLADPRRVPLLINGAGAVPVRVRGAAHVHLEDLVVVGMASASIAIEDAADVRLDNVTVYGGAPGIEIRSAQGVTITRSRVRGSAAPWSSRASMKYRGRGSFLLTATSPRTQTTDLEISYSEFTDSHDGLQIGSVRGVALHHNLFDNFNDDGLLLSERKRRYLLGEVRIFENVFSRILTSLSFGQDTTPGNRVGSGVYVFRNVFDMRRGTYNTPPRDAAGPPDIAFSRVIGDHGSPTWEPLFVYQNTVIGETTSDRETYGAGLLAGTSGTRRRVFNNIFFQARNTPGLRLASTRDDVEVDGNLFWSAGLEPTRADQVFRDHRRSRTVVDSKRRYAPGWGSADRYADPRFVDLLRQDVRLAPGSPAIDAGVRLPPAWPDPRRGEDVGLPDLGAVPAGSAMLRVGPTAAPPITP